VVAGCIGDLLVGWFGVVVAAVGCVVTWLVRCLLCLAVADVLCLGVTRFCRFQGLSRRNPF